MSRLSEADLALRETTSQIEAIERAVMDGANLRSTCLAEAERGEVLGDGPLLELTCMQITVSVLFELLVRNRHDTHDAIRVLNAAGWGRALALLEMRS